MGPTLRLKPIARLRSASPDSESLRCECLIYFPLLFLFYCFFIRYISKVPAPQKISSRLEEAAGQYANPGEESCATLSNLEPASTPYAMYLSAVNRIPSAAGLNATVTRPFEPNPIYAHLLQHRSPPAPGNLTATVSAPNLGTNRLPAPSSAVLSTQRPAAGTDLTDRPDATASQTEDADVPATRTQSQYHSVRGGTVPRSSSSSDRYRQPQDDRLTGLFAKRSISPQINAKQAVPYLSTAQLYKSLPLSAEIQEYEQRLQSMTRHKDAFPGQPLLSRSANVSGNNIYSTLARSYNSDQYGRATTNIVGMGGRLHSSSVSAPNRSADVYSSSSRMGGTPRWAQHQYV